MLRISPLLCQYLHNRGHKWKQVYASHGNKTYFENTKRRILCARHHFLETIVAALAALDTRKVLKLLRLLTTFLLPPATLVALLLCSFAIVMHLLISFKNVGLWCTKTRINNLLPNGWFQELQQQSNEVEVDNKIILQHGIIPKQLPKIYTQKNSPWLHAFLL